MRCELLMRAIVADKDCLSETVMLALKSQVSCKITSSLAWVNLGKLMFGFSIYTCYILAIMQEGMDFSPISTLFALKKGMKQTY